MGQQFIGNKQLVIENYKFDARIYKVGVGRDNHIYVALTSVIGEPVCANGIKAQQALNKLTEAIKAKISFTATTESQTLNHA